MDREKVIGHLNDCLMASRADNTWVFVRKDIIADALALLKEQQQQIWELQEYLTDKLKEQEAVKPRVSSVEQRCGNCNKVIEMDGWITCPWCGKPIDWEGWWKKNGTRNQDT